MHINNIDPHIKLFKDLTISRKNTIKDLNNKNEIKEESSTVKKEERITQIKDDILNGRYKIDYKKVAEKILGYWWKTK